MAKLDLNTPRTRVGSGFRDQTLAVKGRGKKKKKKLTRSLTKENFNQILQGLGLVQAAMYEC